MLIISWLVLNNLNRLAADNDVVGVTRRINRY
jgi:predicted chitinase